MTSFYPSSNVSLILFILLLGFSMCLNAQEIITDRPDQTESSSTIPKNSFQIETGILFSQVNTNSFESNNWNLPTTLLRFGITRNMELRLANQFTSIVKNSEEKTHQYGFGDIEIGAKIQILRKKNINTEIAFLSHLVFPFGDKRISNTNFGSINKLSISHSITKNTSLGYNVGYNYFGEDLGMATYSLAVGFTINDKWGFYIEPYGEWLNFQSIASNLDGGFTYLLQQNIQLDISYGLGLNYHMHYTSLGFSWLIGY